MPHFHVVYFRLLINGIQQSNFSPDPLWTLATSGKSRPTCLEAQNGMLRQSKTLWAAKNFSSNIFLSSKFEWKAAEGNSLSRFENRKRELASWSSTGGLWMNFHLSCQRESENDDFDLHNFSEVFASIYLRKNICRLLINGKGREVLPTTIKTKQFGKVAAEDSPDGFRRCEE